MINGKPTMFATIPRKSDFGFVLSNCIKFYVNRTCTPCAIHIIDSRSMSDSVHSRSDSVLIRFAVCD